ECHEKRLSGQLRGFADAARCSNDRMRQIWADAGFPYMELVDLMAADRLAVAERMDKGELSIAEANVQMAEFGVRVINEAQRRDAESRQTAIQAQQVQQAAFGRTLNILNENLQRQQDGAVLTAGGCSVFRKNGPLILPSSAASAGRGQ